eukprot:TRINITY_DN21682_c0_g1_i1.p1 TRINITY_DN21682_c0_g1~~TRINITY_DN21682_c0_g1_i1.p1  ORF type:complete len:85 (+),score=10.75 TRINITY_DN21682_c0_g1_i1:60-314(+)
MANLKLYLRILVIVLHIVVMLYRHELREEFNVKHVVHGVIHVGVQIGIVFVPLPAALDKHRQKIVEKKYKTVAKIRKNKPNKVD